MSSELIDYLKQENQQLQDQVRELQGLLQINKQALKVLMPQTSDEQNKGLLIVLKNLQEENNTLQLKVDKLVIERNEAQSDQLISQQITEEAMRHEKELISSLQSKMQELQNDLRKSEEKLAHFEEMRPEYDEIAGVVIKYKEVCDTDIVVLKLHNEVQMLSQQLLEEQKARQRIVKEKSNIQGLNLRLMSELLQLKSLAHGGNKIIFMNQDPDQLVEFQGQMLKSMKQNSSASDSEGTESSHSQADSDYSPKVQAQINSNSNTKGKVIPKLDLTRAKQIQEINAKRQTQQTQKPLNDIQSMERIQKLEKALDELRKNHQREMIQNRTLQAHNEELQRICEELEQRIKILVNSNLRYQEKFKKFHQNYSYLHQFYQLHKDIITNNSLSNHHRQTSTVQLDEDVQPQLELEEIESPNNQQQYQYQAQIIQQQQTNIYYYLPNSKDESKKFLLQTAQQIYTTLYEKVDRVINEIPICKHRFRSFSEIIIN